MDSVRTLVIANPFMNRSEALNVSAKSRIVLVSGHGRIARLSEPGSFAAVANINGQNIMFRDLAATSRSSP